MTRYPSFLLVFCTVLLAGCPTDGDDDDAAANSLCNGEQDVGEFTTDDTYDVDGDGFFDASDPGCAANYDSEQLDCDDEDAFVNPAAEEVACNGKNDDCDSATIESSDNDMDGVTDCDGDCDDTRADTYPGAPEVECDGVDQDCDGQDAGDGCALNYAGDWVLDSDVAYSCTNFEMSFSSFVLNQSGNAVQVDTDNCGSCDGPGPLTGEFTSASQLSASGGQAISGGCEAVFSMLVTFLDEDSATGSLSVNFQGADCSSFGCQGQLFSFAGSKEE